MAEVTYANLFTQSRANVVTLISNSSNVADPITPSTGFRKWIYSRDPDVKATDFKGYPIIIIHPATFNLGDKDGSLDGMSKHVTWSIEIEIVTSDRGYGDKDGKGLTYLDAISDDVMTALLNKTNRNTLSGDQMYFSRPEATDSSTEVRQNELVYRRSIIANFTSRIQVSA